MLLRRVDLRLHHDDRCERCAGAGFDGVPEQVAERLPQQHLVALEGAELAAHRDLAAQRPRLGAQFVRGPFADRLQIDRSERELRRAREVQEVGHDLAERLRLGANALDVLTIVCGQRFQIDQLAVAVNRREPVPELVRDAGRQLADRRQAFLQPQLLFEALHGGQIGEQADRAVQIAVVVEQRRNGHAKMGGAVACLVQAHRPPEIGSLVARQSSMTSDSAGSPSIRRWSSSGRRFGDPQHPPAGGIDDPDLAVQSHHEQAGGEALDDFAAQPLATPRRAPRSRAPAP